jgi:thiamine-phosphate pyrophosphorylase
VHLGVHDLSAADVRRLGGENFLIGRSAATSADLTVTTTADYVTLGPVFAADVRRPNGAIGISNFESIVKAATLPVVAIGGISTTTAPEAMRAGAAGVALISGIFGAPDPEQAAREVRTAIGT